VAFLTEHPHTDAPCGARIQNTAMPQAASSKHYRCLSCYDDTHTATRHVSVDCEDMSRLLLAHFRLGHEWLLDLCSIRFDIQRSITVKLDCLHICLMAVQLRNVHCHNPTTDPSWPTVQTPVAQMTSPVSNPPFTYLLCLRVLVGSCLYHSCDITGWHDGKTLLHRDQKCLSRPRRRSKTED
jgi:hypothetical protein